MSNLKRLSFIELGWPIPCARHLLRERYGFRLKELEWLCGGEGEDINKFLIVQDELEVLSIKLAIGHLRFPPFACQRLVQVSGNLRTLQQFLPGRQTITRVQWTPYLDNRGDEGMARLSAEWERITHLSLRGSTLRPKLSPSVNGVFSSLVALEMGDLHRVRGPPPLVDTSVETDRATRKSSQLSLRFLGFVFSWLRWYRERTTRKTGFSK